MYRILKTKKYRFNGIAYEKKKYRFNEIEYEKRKKMSEKANSGTDRRGRRRGKQHFELQRKSEKPTKRKKNRGSSEGNRTD